MFYSILKLVVRQCRDAKDIYYPVRHHSEAWDTAKELFTKPHDIVFVVKSKDLVSNNCVNPRASTKVEA